MSCHVCSPSEAETEGWLKACRKGPLPFYAPPLLPSNARIHQHRWWYHHPPSLPTSQVGLSNDSSPACSLPEAGLTSLCTTQFSALRALGAPDIFLHPGVSVNVAPGSPATPCTVSHCQGGVLQVAAGGGTASGTFYKRGSLEETFPVTASATTLESGDAGVAVAVSAAPGITCTLLYVGSAGEGSIDLQVSGPVRWG